MKRTFTLFFLMLLIAIVSAEPKKKSRRVSPTPAPKITSTVEPIQTSTPAPSATADTDHGFPKKIIGISNPHNGEVIVLKPKFFFLRDKFENIKDYFPTTTRNQTVLENNNSVKKNITRKAVKPQPWPMKVRPEMVESTTVRPEVVGLFEDTTVRPDISLSNQEIVESPTATPLPFKRGPNRVVIRRRPVPKQRFRIIILDPHTPSHQLGGGQVRFAPNRQFRRRPVGYQQYLRRPNPVKYGFI